jgi:hypothetical protein
VLARRERLQQAEGFQAHRNGYDKLARNYLASVCLAAARFNEPEP